MPGFSVAFYIAPHNNFTNKLRKYGLDKNTAKTAVHPTAKLCWEYQLFLVKTDEWNIGEQVSAAFQSTWE